MTKVCDLPHGRELHADVFGTPYISNPPAGLRVAGWISEVLSYVNRHDKDAVNRWQADPNNDSLRARGDPRWQAACSFTQRKVWPKEA